MLLALAQDLGFLAARNSQITVDITTRENVNPTDTESCRHSSDIVKD